MAATRREIFPVTSTLLSLVAAYAPQYTHVFLFLVSTFNLSPELLYNIFAAVRRYWKPIPKSTKLTLVFKEKDGLYRNQMFNAAEAFLGTKVNPNSNRLRITKRVREDSINVKFAKSEAIVDSFEGVSLAWKYVILEGKQKGPRVGGVKPEKKHIELVFEKEHKETVIKSYLPWILEKSKELEAQKKVVKLYNLQWPCTKKESVNFEHPSTFDTLALEPEMKKTITDDLDLFLRRRDYYKKVGKVWKRGYLLYGPPGTGKSSLIGAMANYLKFDIYDIQLNSVHSDSCLKKLMLDTSNRSMIVFEDIDCSMQSHDREGTSSSNQSNSMFSLSGLLNFIDGLWSSCGDQRIIIFTTNHKDKLDPALLRPGRMDVHIHMSYLTMGGFKILAANYLNIHDHHWRFSEIEELINGGQVTPAEVAEELMKSDDKEVVLEGVVNVLKRKKMEADNAKEGIDKGKEDNLIIS